MRIVGVAFAALLAAAVSLPSMAAAQVSRIQMEQHISESCKNNSFKCGPLEKYWRDRIADLDADTRVKMYESIAINRNTWANILMAICERYKSDGISREYDCAVEWGDYISQHPDIKLGSALGNIFGPQNVDDIKRRSKEIGLLYWPDQMLSSPPNDQGGLAASTTLQVRENGHFYAKPVFDGIEVEAMVDTGASMVLLSREDAEAIGINVDALSFSEPVDTASGPAKFAVANVRNLQIYGVHLSNIKVLVSKQYGTVSLLGMPVLRAFKSLVVSNGEMTLQP